MKSFRAQFGHPTGLVGRLVGVILALENRQRIEWAVNLLGVQPTDIVLEIGFGPGVGIQFLAAKATQGLVAGVDISKVMVEQASRRNAQGLRAGRVELWQGTAENLPYVDQYLDKVLTINSFHIWPDKQPALHEIYRTLKPGGTLAIVEQPPEKITQRTVIEARGQQIQQSLLQAGFKDFELIYGDFKRGWAVCVRQQGSLKL